MRVNEVVVPVTVTNTKGEFVPDLERNEFHVFDGGIEQSIRTWSAENEPLSLVLVIETSSHVESLMPMVHKNAIVFTEQVMALEAEAGVISYDSDVKIVQPFTRDHDAVEKSIEQTVSGESGIRLYDAMGESERMLEAQPKNRRRVMLIIGEAQDFGSSAKPNEIMGNALRADISIYAIGLSSSEAELKGGETLPLTIGKDTPPISAAPPGRDPRFDLPYVDWMTPSIWILERATNQIRNHRFAAAIAATGGVHYNGPSTSSVSNALDRIGTELRSQYVLTYAPNGERAAGFNEIRVTVSRPHVTVRTRPGYWVSAEGVSQSKP